jgi:hypothetical protein
MTCAEVQQTRYHLFFDYGDAKAYRHELPKLRRALRPSRKRKQ